MLKYFTCALFLHSIPVVPNLCIAIKVIINLSFETNNEFYRGAKINYERVPGFVCRFNKLCEFS